MRLDLSTLATLAVREALAAGCRSDDELTAFAVTHMQRQIEADLRKASRKAVAQTKIME